MEDTAIHMGLSTKVGTLTKITVHKNVKIHYFMLKKLCAINEVLINAYKCHDYVYEKSTRNDDPLYEKNYHIFWCPSPIFDKICDMKNA